MFKTLSFIKEGVRSLKKMRLMNKLFIVIFLFSVYSVVHATTPSPGHSWVGVGDALWAATGMTSLRTYTFPNIDAGVLTDYDIVQGDLIVGTAASTTAILSKDTNSTRYLSNKGASNQPTWSTVSMNNGVTGILPIANGGTGNVLTSFTGPATSAKTFTLPDSNATILTDNADVTLAQGGTNASLTASNGGIFYSTGSAAAILSGVAAAGRVLLSGNSAAPTWSTAVYPGTAGASSSVMVSNGTNFVSQSQMVSTVQTTSYNATGATTAKAISSLTVANIGMFNVPQAITVNQMSFTVTAVTTGGTMKLCVYSDTGAKLIDLTTATITATTISTTVSPAVTLAPGNYYIANLCATTCSDTVSYFTSTSVASMNGASIPAGKKAMEGTGTMTSGTCNATLPTITGAASATINARLDN